MDGLTDQFGLLQLSTKLVGAGALNRTENLAMFYSLLLSSLYTSRWLWHSGEQAKEIGIYRPLIKPTKAPSTRVS